MAFMEPENSLLFPQQLSKSDALCSISLEAIFYGEKLLAPRPYSKLKDHPMSSVRQTLLDLSIYN